jgi:acetyltransferase-like isoleucine patch superfamily enzyme
MSRWYAFAIGQLSVVELQGRVAILGKPIVDIRDGCKLVIGDNVTLNSRNKGYHINMHSPVKLFADRPNATIRIGANTRLHGSCIHAYESVTVGRNCLIAANCQIFDGSGHDLSFQDVENRVNTRGESRPVAIGDNVWVGANCVILPGVSIGSGSVIAANSVVTKDVPPMVVAGGNPAVVIRAHSDEGAAR